MATIQTAPAIQWNPFAVETRTLRAPHSPEACAALLKPNLYRYWTVAENTRPFTGSIRGGRFALMKHSPYIRNPFKPVAYGQMASDGAGGASLSVRLALGRIVRGWLALALLACAAIFAGMLVSPAVVKPGKGLAAIILAALVSAMIPFAALCALYLAAAWFARNDRAYLMATLIRLLDATPSA